MAQVASRSQSALGSPPQQFEQRPALGQPMPSPHSPQPTNQTQISRIQSQSRENPSAAPPLHPEIKSIVQLHLAHAHKIYYSGRLIRKIERQPDGQRPAKDDGWVDVWAQLGGTTLSVWDMKAIDEASKRGEEVPPSYINVTDAFVQVLGSVTIPPTATTPSKKYTNVLTLNTAGSNLLLFSCPSTADLISWAAALRLSAWEKSRLEEIYTAHLLRLFLSDRGAWNEPPSSLVRGKLEGPIEVRIAGQTDWKPVWMVVTAPNTTGLDNLDRTHSPEKNSVTKRRMSSLFNRQTSDFNVHGPPQPATVVLYASSKPKDRKKPLLTLRNVSQAFSVYPERPELINRSTLIKIEGLIGDEESAGGMKNREGWLLIMPEVEPAKSGTMEMLKWLIAFHDAFGLYGRPLGYKWDPRDHISMLFAYPVGPQRDNLFLDRELAEPLDPRDDRVSAIRSRLIHIQLNRMRQGPLEGVQEDGEGPENDVIAAPAPQITPPAQKNGAAQAPTSDFPQLPPLDFSGERNGNGTTSGSPPGPQRVRSLTPITERSNTRETSQGSVNNQGLQGRPSLDPSSRERTSSNPSIVRGENGNVPTQADKHGEPLQGVPENDGVLVISRDMTDSPNSNPASPPPIRRESADSSKMQPGSRPDSKLSHLPQTPPIAGVPAARPSSERANSHTRSSSFGQTASVPADQERGPVSPLSPRSTTAQSPSVYSQDTGPAIRKNSAEVPSSGPPPRQIPAPRDPPQSSLPTPPVSADVGAPYGKPAQPLSSKLAVQSPQPTPLPISAQPDVAPPAPPTWDRAHSHRHQPLPVPPPPPILPTDQTKRRPDYEYSEPGALYVLQQEQQQQQQAQQAHPTRPAPVRRSTSTSDDTSDSSAKSPVLAASQPQTRDNYAPVQQPPTSPVRSSHSRFSEDTSQFTNPHSPPKAPPAPSQEAQAGPSNIQSETQSKTVLGRKPSGARAPPGRRFVASEIPPDLHPVEDEDDEDDDEPAEAGPSTLRLVAPSQSAQSADDQNADALAALTFLEQSNDQDTPAVPPQPQFTKPGPPPQIPEIRVPSPPPQDPVQYRSSFAPSKQAAERKAKTQAQQAASQAAAQQPGRPNGRPKQAKVGGAWNDSSEEEEEDEEDEEDEEADERATEGRSNARQPSRQYNGPEPPLNASTSRNTGYGYDEPPRPAPPPSSMSEMGQRPSDRSLRPPRTLPAIPNKGPGSYEGSGSPGRRQEYEQGPRQTNDDESRLSQNHGQARSQHSHHVPPSRQTVWSTVLDPSHGQQPQQPQRDTFIQIDQNETMTKAFTPQGLLHAGLQDKQDRSAKRQEELARESGASLINVPSKPPPPQTGLLGAITGYERDRKREGGVGAALTEREREKRVAEDRQRKLDDFQRQQLEHQQQMAQGTGSVYDMYGGQPMQSPYGTPMMGNPMMMGMNPMMGGFMNGYPPTPGMMPGFSNPQQLFAAQQAAQAYQQAMMSFSAAGSQVGGDGGGSPAMRPLSPQPTGSMGMGMMPMNYDPRMSMAGMGMPPMGMGMGMGGMGMNMPMGPWGDPRMSMISPGPMSPFGYGPDGGLQPPPQMYDQGVMQPQGGSTSGSPAMGPLRHGTPPSRGSRNATPNP
ncbi:hypothetical protein SISNIDRAFT_453997 [Sistotremastrum niveocremeum HHB9708]|uniref:PH domain-containing protein n=1 Tax=Sistotremastrum niveocremeum HHB9708 TaxID=1314777 RepID=A0A164VLF7_9AGAM|nr:hypothetical protein SISNIDRAFT_453997 [Sistotremastrum niveocremeum HHB9708]